MAQVQDEIHLVAAGGAPEVKTRLLSPVYEGPVDFAENGVFQQGAAHGPQQGVAGVEQSREVSRQGGVQEVKFGRFHQALAQVRVVWPEKDDLKAGFQHREPGSRCVHRNADVAGDFADVEDLRGPGGQGHQKTVEVRQVGDVLNAADVPFQVGLHVGGHPEPRVPFRLNDQLRKAAAEDLREDLLGIQGFVRRVEEGLGFPERWGVRRERAFGGGEGQECQNGNPAGQRLRDALHQGKALGAGEDVAPFLLPVGVHVPLDVVEQLRSVLDLVQHHRRRILGEEKAGIVERQGAHVRLVQVHEPVCPGERVLQRGGLAGLPRSGEHQSGKLPCRLAQCSFQSSGKVAWHV